MIEQAVAAGLAPRDRFTTVYSGMETEQFAPNPELRRRFRSEWGVAEDDVVVGTIARLFEHKGYEEILAAMPAAVTREPRLRFVWIGDGANRTRYEQQLARLGLRDHVHLVGLVHPREVAFQINGFDIVLHASRWEGLPRALVQGLLTGIPAISFDNDGAPEVVHPGMTGYLVPLGSINGLADAMVKLATDAPRRREMGMKGRAWCLERFDWHRMVEQIETLYIGPVKPNRGNSAQLADRWCKNACE
jgi:glycosyltransferase involved in cell wall biosynthesis